MSNQARAAVEVIIFILLLPFILLWEAAAKRRCVLQGGHHWKNDWPAVTENTLAVYDYCENCPAARRMEFSPKTNKEST